MVFNDDGLASVGLRRSVAGDVRRWIIHLLRTVKEEIIVSDKLWPWITALAFLGLALVPISAWMGWINW